MTDKIGVEEWLTMLAADFGGRFPAYSLTVSVHGNRFEEVISHLRRLQKMEVELDDEVLVEYRRLRERANKSSNRLVELAGQAHPPENEWIDARSSLGYHLNNLHVFLDKNVDAFIALIQKNRAELEACRKDAISVARHLTEAIKQDEWCQECGLEHIKPAVVDAYAKLCGIAAISVGEDSGDE